MKKREGIIPLTQTEIMLVLATVILLLLVAKDASLNKATLQLKEIGAATAATTTTPSVPADPDAPVNDVLVAGGGPESDDLVLAGPDSDGDSENGSREDIRNPAQVPPKANPDTSASPSSPTPGSASHPDSKTQSPEPDSTIRTDGAPAATPPRSGHDTLGRLVGFDPCWRRHRDLGRQYYYAYDVTFERGSDDGRFLITPHSDLGAGVRMIDDALKGDLRVLLAYPRQPMTFDEFRNFGRDVESALAPMRHERPDYTENCLLAVTLDGDAPGRVAEFVRVAVRLYPVTR